MDSSLEKLTFAPPFVVPPLAGLERSRAAFSRDTEARNGLAGGRVRIKLSLKIFQVKSKVQDIHFLNFVFRHADPPIFRVDSLRWLIFFRCAISSSPFADQQKLSYSTPMNCCNAIATVPNTARSILARYVGYASVMQLPLQLVRDVITTPRQASDINVIRRSQLIRGEGSRRSRPTAEA